MVNESSQRSFGSHSGLQRYIVPVLFACLAGIPIVYYGFNSERARWISARSELLYESGQFEESFDLMEKATELAPQNQTLRLSLAEKWMQHDRADKALDLLDEITSNSTDPRYSLRTKAECLLYLGRFEDALATVKKISDYLQPSDFSDVQRLNELAYFRALAGVELNIAKDDIESAIGQFADTTWKLGRYEMSTEDQSLVSCAFVSRHVGRTDLVTDLLNRRVADLEEQLRSTRQSVSAQTYKRLTETFPLKSRDEKNVGQAQNLVASQEQFLALFYCVRALIHQDHGDAEACDRDRIRVRKLNYEPEELLSMMQLDWELMYNLLTQSQLLDTRAMVRYAQGEQLGLALNDLNIAVLSMQLLRLTEDGLLQNNVRDEKGEFFRSDKLVRTEAVIRKHRADVLSRRGQLDAAEEDFEEIEALGFARDDLLF